MVHQLDARQHDGRQHTAYQKTEALTLDASVPGRLLLGGELDIATARQLSDALSGSLDGDLELDLAALEFCDCAGLTVLLMATRAQHERGHRLTLRRTPARLQRLIGLAGLDSVLDDAAD